MKIIAINSSPRTENRSKTSLMLDHLAGGMRDAGADVDIVNLREKRIKKCAGCFTCWTKTPGKCVHKDDMTEEIFPKWLASDMAVYASPIYYHTMNGAMSIFRERTLPAVQPFFELDEGRIYHPLGQKVPAVVWLSVCGFPEVSEFDAMSEFLYRTKHRDISIVAEIYRASADMLTNPFFKEKAGEILGAVTQAGRELVQSMKISPETMEIIRQPLADSATFAEMGNLFWKTCIAEGVTPAEFSEKNLVPRPDSVKTFSYIMPFAIDSKAVQDREVILQFMFSGEVEGACHFKIGQAGVVPEIGEAKDPDIRVDTPFEVWMDILTRKADGQQMFMEQKYTVQGDLALMIELFKK